MDRPQRYNTMDDRYYRGPQHGGQRDIRSSNKGTILFTLPLPPSPIPLPLSPHPLCLLHLSTSFSSSHTTVLSSSFPSICSIPFFSLPPFYLLCSSPSLPSLNCTHFFYTTATCSYVSPHCALTKPYFVLLSPSLPMNYFLARNQLLFLNHMPGSPDDEMFMSDASERSEFSLRSTQSERLTRSRKFRYSATSFHTRIQYSCDIDILS